MVESCSAMLNRGSYKDTITSKNDKIIRNNHKPSPYLSSACLP